MDTIWILYTKQKWNPKINLLSSIHICIFTLISLLFKLLIVSTFYLEGYYIKCIMSFIYTVFKNKLLN